jgi:molybdopterin molybdotransferase
MLAPRLPAELVALEAAPGRLLAEDVCAVVSLPPFTASAMDGWAVRAADTPAELSIVGESAAGAPWAGRIVAGQAVRISTGAQLPDGADSVVPNEDADARVGRVRVGTAPLGAHVRMLGEVIEAGATLLSAGTVVAPHAVAGIAATGHVRLPCAARPRVAVLATGSELVPLGWPLPAGAIYDASRVGVAAQARWAGAQVVA